MLISFIGIGRKTQVVLLVMVWTDNININILHQKCIYLNPRRTH